jgi:glucose uptake protein GlcU
MFGAVSTPRKRRVTLALLIAGVAFALGAIIVGISDNPPGIALAFLAATASILSFVHPWRNTNEFVLLVTTSVLAFVLLVILHNVADGIAEFQAVGSLSRSLVEAVGVMAFLAAVLACPPAFLIGVVGALATFTRSRRRAT